MPTLILSPRHTESSQVLWRKAVQIGWEVERFHGWKIPEDFQPKSFAIYGEPLYNDVIAEHLGTTIPMPPEDFLTRLPLEMTGRNVYYMDAIDARKIDHRVFVKPPNQKTFKAGIYESGAGIPQNVPDDEAVLVQDIVQFLHEYRLFLLDGHVVAQSSYMVDGLYAKQSEGWNDPKDLSNASSRYGQEVCTHLKEIGLAEMLGAVVIDVGYIPNKGWRVIEANEINASGIYNADPYRVLLALEHATRKK